MTKSATQYATLFYEIQIVIHFIVQADRYESIAGKYLKQKNLFVLAILAAIKKMVRSIETESQRVACSRRNSVWETA